MRIAASSQWASEIAKLIVAELENAKADDNMLRIFCTVPFKTNEEKKEHRKKLDQLRDESQHTVFTLDTLTNKMTRVQQTKAARDKIDDSYWDNDHIELERERGEAKLAEYRVKAREHIQALNQLMFEISTDKRLALMASTLKQLPKPGDTA